MLDDAQAQTWFGGIFCPTQRTPLGLYRPEVGAWVSRSGDLLGMIAQLPGHGHRALEQALQVALRRNGQARPARLAVQDDRLRERLRACTDLPIEPRGFGGFDGVVGAALDEIAAHESPPARAERSVSHAFARTLFLSSGLLPT